MLNLSMNEQKQILGGYCVCKAYNKYTGILQGKGYGYSRSQAYDDLVDKYPRLDDSDTYKYVYSTIGE